MRSQITNAISIAMGTTNDDDSWTLTAPTLSPAELDAALARALGDELSVLCRCGRKSLGSDHGHLCEPCFFGEPGAGYGDANHMGHR